MSLIVRLQGLKGGLSALKKHDWLKRLSLAASLAPVTLLAIRRLIKLTEPVKTYVKSL